MSKKMNKENTKRERQENWSQPEKELLRELIRRHINVVDDKRNDIKMISKKKAAWSDIEYHMKAAGYNRPSLKLKEQWHRMKVAARKSNALMQKALRATGNVVEIPQPPEEDLIVQDMIKEDFKEDSILIDSNTQAFEIEYLEESVRSLENVPTPIDEDSYCEPVFSNESAPVEQLRRLPKKGPKKPPVDVLQQRSKQICSENRQKQELHKLKLDQIKKQMSYEKTLFEKELQIKNTVLERQQLLLKREKNETI